MYFYTHLLSLAHIMFNCFVLSSLKESEVNLSRLLVVTSLQWWDYRCTKQVNLWRVLCKQSKKSSSLYDEFQQETLVVTINLAPFIKMITRIILRNRNTIFEYALEVARILFYRPPKISIDIRFFEFKNPNLYCRGSLLLRIWCDWCVYVCMYVCIHTCWF